MILFRNLTIVLLLSISYSSFAQQIITDRPDQTEASSTIPKGSLQIESGVLIGFTDSESFNTRQILAPTNLFRYGITKGIELRLVNQLEILAFDSKGDIKDLIGVSDLQLGTKIQILKKEDVNTEIAFMSHLIMPTGSDFLTIDDFGTINKLCISHAINDNIGIGYNIGYDYFGTGNGDLTYSLALGIGVNDKMSIYIEPYGAITDFEELAASFDAGFTYLVRDNVQLDFSFGTGINYNMNYISAGASWNISKQ